MSLLLDTHAALWFFQADSRLPASTRERTEDAGLAAHVSVASLWEIAIKVSLHKLTLPGEFETLFPSSVPQSGLTLLPIAVAHIAAVLRLEHHHRDPFDRLLIAHAKTEGLMLVSCDPHFPPPACRCCGSGFHYSSVTC